MIPKVCDITLKQTQEAIFHAQEDKSGAYLALWNVCGAGNEGVIRGVD